MNELLIQRRVELQEHLAAAWQKYSEATASRQKSEVEVGRWRREVATRHKARAAGMASDDDVAKSEQKLADAEAAYERELATANAALDASKAIEYQLMELLRDHVEVYAEEAEQYTQLAQQAMVASLGTLRTAKTAWEAAQAAWVPLAKALGLDAVAPFPLPDPDQLLSDLEREATAARPQRVHLR